MSSLSEPQGKYSYRDAFMEILPLFASLMASLLLMGVLLFSRIVYQKEQAFNEALAEVPVKIHGQPLVSQASVDFAMDVYGIEKPHHSAWPRLDRKLMDRGLTVGSSLGKNRVVTVGAPAFDSWGLLGSTLAHEIEVHANQSFLSIQLSDAVRRGKQFAFNWLNKRGSRLARFFEPELYGTIEAEREAYIHEMNSAKRFGLSDYEVQNIFNVMERYYPIVHTKPEL